jgi:peptide methionine sulfoxide reductase MsrB
MNQETQSPIPEGYVILCKKCGEDLGYIFDEHPKVTSHEELTAITKEWVYVQRT